MLCTSVDNPTDEDVIPKWLVRAFNVQERTTTVSVAEEYGEKHQVKTLERFQVTLDGGLWQERTTNGSKGLNKWYSRYLNEWPSGANRPS